jgi:hypothetical protein
MNAFQAARDLERLDECAELYAESVRSLVQWRAAASRHQYRSLLERVDRAKLKCDKARAAIDAHAENPGCSS